MFSYDAENKQRQVLDGNNKNAEIGMYKYDGDGRRVIKETTSEGQTFLCMMRLASWRPNIQQVRCNDSQNKYLTTDHRLTARDYDQAGKCHIEKRLLPFGVDLSTPQRTTALGYVSV
jgi:hypothetical protein